MKRYEKNAYFRFFGLFLSAFMLMYMLLATLYYLQEHTRLSKELELTQQLNYIECRKLEMGDFCDNSEPLIVDMNSVKKSIFYVLVIVLLIFVPISVMLAFFSIRPVRQASMMIDNFIANIVHDINTPIATIMLNSKSMIKKATTNPKKLQRILSSAKQLSDMQYDLLALADEREDIVFDALDVKPVIEEIVEGFTLQYPTQPFELSLMEHTVHINAVDFRRITQNLLSNAVKYNRDENPIKIYLQESILTIEDAGMGIKNPKKVFDKNYREDYTIQGNGLGLASVLAMISRNNIEIEVSSRVNIGTTIKLLLNKH